MYKITKNIRWYDIEFHEPPYDHLIIIINNSGNLHTAFWKDCDLDIFKLAYGRVRYWTDYDFGKILGNETS